MGNNTSSGRSSEETHGLRDVRRDAEQEQARPSQTKCLNSTNRFSDIGAQLRGQKSSNLPNCPAENYVRARSLLLENEYSSSTNNSVVIKEPRSLSLDLMESEERTAKQQKSTYTYDNVGVRTAACHAEERTAQRVEEGLSSLQLMSMRDDQVQSPTITSRLHKFEKVEKGSLLEPDVRELAELLRSPLPSYNVRELAGPPKSSLPDAGIQELAEHQRTIHHRS